MKVLVFGAGVIGSYLATRLYESDVDVSMLARGEKFLNIKDQGVILEDFFNHEQTVSRKLLGSEYAEIALAGHAEAARKEMRALADGFLVLCEKSNVSYGAFKNLSDNI